MLRQRERGRWTGVPFDAQGRDARIADTSSFRPDEFGRRIAALGVSRDVTDRKNLEQLKKDRETNP